MALGIQATAKCCGIAAHTPMSAAADLLCLSKASTTKRDMHPREQTIFALSSGRAPSAIAIVRMSGPEAATALIGLAGKVPPPRVATRALLRDAGGGPIDDSVVLWFPAPASA